MDDQNPLQKACHVLQDHWQHIAQHASQLHGHVGSQLQRLRATSTKGELSEQNSAHFRRRKPAFASISMAEDFPSRGRGGADIDPDASQGDNRGDDKSSKKKRKQHKRAEKFRLELEQLSSEERASVARDAAIRGDIARDVGFAGRKVTVGELIDEVQAQQNLLGPKASAVPKYDTVQRGASQVPGKDLRPGAPKMQLRPHEEAQLPLDLLGKGALWTPRPLLGYAFGGIRDAGFGLYGRCNILKAILEDRWAGEDPNKVLVNEDYYQDLIDSAPATELTMMAVPCRDIPLPLIRTQVEHRMREALTDRLGDSIPPHTLEALDQIGKAISSEHLKQTGIIKGNDLLADTNVIVSACPDGAFTVEAIKPFKELKDRKTVFLCRCGDPHLTHALFSMALGPKPICEETKIVIGQGALYITNGFKFGPNPDNPNQVLGSDTEDIHRPPTVQPTFQELLHDKQAGPLSQSFQVDADDDESAKKPYLNHIRHGLRKQKKQLSHAS